MGASVKKLGAPVQPEVGRKLAVLGMLMRQADDAIPVIDLCRAVVQMDPSFFSAELSAPMEVVLQAIARGRNTVSEASWARVDEAARREAERDHPADASGARSARGQERFEARVRAVRARLSREERRREQTRLQVFEAGAAALKTAYYALSDVERAGLVARGAGENDADLFVAAQPWTIG
jgi:hypothetical protein